MPNTWDDNEKEYLQKQPRPWQDALKEAEGWKQGGDKGLGLADLLGLFLGQDKQNQFSGLTTGLMEWLSANADKLPSVMPSLPKAKAPKKDKKPKIRAAGFNEEFKDLE